MRALFSALVCVMASVVSAQSQTNVTNGQAFGNWRVNCTATAPGQTACVLGQEILRTDDRALIAQLLAFQTPDGSKTFLSARVPLGVYFPAGFAIRAEEGGEILQFVWQTCGTELCEAVAEVTPEQMADFGVEGKNILGSYRPNIRAENLVFRFQMAGGAEGLAALASAKENE